MGSEDSPVASTSTDTIKIEKPEATASLEGIATIYKYFKNNSKVN